MPSRFLQCSAALVGLPLITLSAVMISHAHPASPGAINETGSGLLLATNKGAHTLSIIDPQQGASVAEVPEGGITGHELAASPDGRTAFVPIYGNSGVGKPGTDGRNIAVIDIAARKVTNNIEFSHGVRPHCAVFGPKDHMLYVTTELDKTISIIDPKTLSIVGAIPTNQAESHMLAISSDGRRGYTANVGPGTVSVLDLEARKPITVIPVSKQVQRISVTPDGSMVFTTDQAKPQVAVIDAATNRIKTWIPLPSMGFASTPTHDGKWLLVMMPGVNKVAIVDLATLKVVHTVDTPGTPQEALVRPDDKIAYVSCDVTAQVAAIRTADWTVEKLIPAGKTVDGLAWAPQQ